MIAKFTQRFEGVDWLPIIFAGLAIVAGAIGGLLLIGLSSPLLIFAGIVGMVGAAVIIANPEWGLVGLAVITYANLSDVLKSEYGVPSIAQPYIVLLILTILARWFLYGERPRGWKIPLLIIGSYGFVTFLSLFYARSFTIAQNGVIDYAKYAVTVLIVVVLMQRGVVFHRVIWALLGVGAFLGTISVIQSLTGTFDNTYGGFARPPVVNVADGEETARLAGPIGDPNFYAQTMLVLLPLALDRFWNARSKILRIVALYTMSVIAMTILFSFSRGAFLASIVAVGIMFIGRRVSPLSFIIAPLAIVALLQVAPANYTDRLSTLIDLIPGQAEEGTTDQSFRGRSSEMIAAWMMFNDYPLLGVGVGNYNVRYLEYSRQIGLDGRRVDRSAHSLYLEIAAEKGLFGVSVFVVMMGMVFYFLFRSSNMLYEAGNPELAGLIKGLGAGMVGYMITSIFLHDAFPRYFWLLIGICLSTMQVARYEIHQIKQNRAKQAI